MINKMASTVESKSSEDEEVSSEESEDEEEEPKLTYSRLANDLPKILHKDAASTIAVHQKFLVLGTHYGRVYMLDHQGNKICKKEVALHSATVNQISIDSRGDHLASCADDGRIVIQNLYSGEQNFLMTLDRPVKSVALDPYYSNSTGRFISGTDKVKLHEKGALFSRYKETVIYQGEGPIRLLSWRENLVAMALDKSVRVFDVSRKSWVTVVKETYLTPNIKPEFFHCNLYWKDNSTLLIGKVDTIKVLNINLKTFSTVVSSIITTPNYLCGVAPFTDQIVTLSLPKHCEEEGARPLLTVIEDQMDLKYHELCRATLCVKGYHKYSIMHYYLDCLPEEGLFFIVSPKDVILAKPWEEDDHITWLLTKEKFQEAVTSVIQSKNLKDHTLLSVGHIALENLFNRGRYHEAASLCPQIFGLNVGLWEEEVYKFTAAKQLRAIASFVPYRDPCLSHSVYEMILKEFISQTDIESLLESIRAWPKDIYKVESIIALVQEEQSCSLDGCPQLEPVSAELYLRNHQPEQAFAIFLKLEEYRVFSLISEHKLYNAVKENLGALMKLDADRTTAFTVENINHLPIHLVVEKLKSSPLFLYKYLDGVVFKNPLLAGEHHGLLVKLYAEYEPAKLMSFLKSSNTYPLEESLKICQTKSLNHEAIFLLGRMGNTKQALQEIIGNLKDVKKAIEFCQDYDEPELWSDLINASIDKPEFITILLENLGSHINPIVLLQKIPQKLEIMGLRDSLVQLLQDFNLQISLKEGCKRILVSDCFSLLEKLNRQQKRGLSVDENQLCLSCHRKLLSNDIRNPDPLCLFFCRHGFHQNCISNIFACPICSAQKKEPFSQKG